MNTPPSDDLQPSTLTTGNGGNRGRSVWVSVAYALLIVFALSLGVVTWGAYRVYRMIADLPDRIVFDMDDAAFQESFREAFVDSTKMALRDGEKPQRLEIMRFLEESGPAAKDFLNSLEEAACDEDPEIVAAAESAIAAIQAE